MGEQPVKLDLKKEPRVHMMYSDANEGLAPQDILSCYKALLSKDINYLNRPPPI